MIETIYLMNAIENAILGKAAFPALTNCYLCLFTADPTTAGSWSNEVAGGGYARVAIKDLMGTPASGQVVNTADIETAVASGSWGTITHYGLATSLGVGTGFLTLYKALGGSAQAINTGGKFKIPAGGFTLRSA